MVICNDHSHPALLCLRDFIGGGYSVVAGHDGIHMVLFCLFDQLTVDPVTVLHPVRNIGIHIRPQTFQPFQQDICGRYAVYIIIADDPDPGSAGGFL